LVRHSKSIHSFLIGERNHRHMPKCSVHSGRGCCWSLRRENRWTSRDAGKTTHASSAGGGNHFVCLLLELYCGNMTTGESWLFRCCRMTTTEAKEQRNRMVTNVLFEKIVTSIMMMPKRIQNSNGLEATGRPSRGTSVTTGLLMINRNASQDNLFDESIRHFTDSYQAR
jgi:hypothetical protein